MSDARRKFMVWFTAYSARYGGTRLMEAENIAFQAWQASLNAASDVAVNDTSTEPVAEIEESRQVPAQDESTDLLELRRRIDMQWETLKQKDHQVAQYSGRIIALESQIRALTQQERVRLCDACGQPFKQGETVICGNLEGVLTQTHPMCACKADKP